MVTIPDRFGPLIARLEAGETVAQTDVDRLAQLQALDLAKIGEDFARERIAADEAMTKALAAALEV